MMRSSKFLAIALILLDVSASAYAAIPDCGRGTEWVVAEQACVSSQLVQQENRDRRASFIRPAVRTKDSDMILEVNEGQNVVVSVGGETFNLADLPLQMAEMKVAQDELKRTIAEDFADKIKALQEEMVKLKSEIAADLNTGIATNAAGIATNAAAAKTNGESAAANKVLSKANAVVSAANKALANTNEGQVEANTGGIAANKAGMAANTKLVAAHELTLNPPCKDNIKWVRFQAGGTGNPKMLGGYGIAEVKRLEAGIYNVVFKQNYPDSKFAIALMAEEQGWEGIAKRRVVASIGPMRGREHSFGNMMHTDRMIVETRSTKNGNKPQDHPVIVNFAVFREDKDQHTCNNYIKTKDWGTALRYTTYLRQDNLQRGQVHVENGLKVEGKGGVGQNIALTPAAPFASSYSVASCASGSSDGTYMGLEGYIMKSSYHMYKKERFTQDTRQDGNGRPSNEGKKRVVSSVVFQKSSKFDDKKMKMLTFRGGSLSNTFANVGVKSLKKIGRGTYRIEWTHPFKDAHYAVFGLANMWCSGGQMMHVADSRDFKQTASQTQITTTYPYRDYQKADGQEDGTSCAFMTLIAIGDYN